MSRGEVYFTHLAVRGPMKGVESAARQNIEGVDIRVLS
jgi:hypothetical protein